MAEAERPVLDAHAKGGAVTVRHSFIDRAIDRGLAAQRNRETDAAKDVLELRSASVVRGATPAAKAKDSPYPSSVGLRNPAHRTAVGKVLLAHLPEREVDALIPADGGRSLA